MSNWKELQARLNAYQAGTTSITEEDSKFAQLPVGRAGNPGRIGPVGPVVAPPPSQNETFTPDEFVSPVTIRDILGAPAEHPGNQNLTDQAIREGYGQSRFDTRSGYTPGQNLEDIRAREQSAAGKITNGILKGATTFLATFADTTLGTVVGAAYAFSPVGMAFGLRPEDSLERFATNPVSQTITRWNKFAEENIPNYRTEEEQSDDYQQEWYKPRNFFSANNIGDGIIKNFGFTVGAMAGGLTWGKLLGFGKAAQASNDVMKGVSMAASGDAEAANVLKNLAPSVRNATTKASAQQFAKNAKDIARRHNLLPMSQQLTGSLIAAAGEGKTEGLMSRDEFLEDYLPRLQEETNAQLAAAEEELLQNRAFQQRIYDPNDPNAEPQIVLNEDGQVALQRRQNEIYELFRRKQQMAYDQADELATLTFALNLPILTGSNAIQFGRLLGGGWRSARQAATRAGGRLRFRNGIPVANYAGSSRLIGTARAIGRLGGSEAMEEMLQGTVSSGAKQIADDRLTAFNDLSYDVNSMNNVRDSFASFLQGGTDYLGDFKNWQEGAIGALTGLFGMPGRGYFRGERGGIPAALAEGRNESNESRAVAEKLNNYVNSDAFRNRYRNWVRHDALNAKVNEDAASDDEYAFHTDDDALLINDIIMFSDAGRLDDLKMIAKRFSNLSEDDIEDARQQLSSQNGEIEKETDEQVKERVEKQANKILDSIKEYDKVQGLLRARMPMNASSDILKETTYTAMQMKNFENRFLNMLGETIDALDPILYAKTDPNKTAQERKAEVVAMQSDYAKIFSGDLVPISEAKQKETDEKLDTLAGIVRGNEALEKKVSDMRKLMTARQKFFDKMRRLENTTPEQFNEEAKTEEKVQVEAEKQAARDEAAELTTLDAVHEAYNRYKAEGKGHDNDFIGRIRQARSSNPAVDKFLSIHDVWSDLRGDIIQNFGGRSLALQIADDIFDHATEAEDMLNKDNIPSYDNIARTLLESASGSESATENMLLAATRAQKAARDLATSMDNVAGRRGKTIVATNTEKQLQEVIAQKKKQRDTTPQKKNSLIRVVTDDSTTKEPPQPITEAPKPKRQKKTASVDADGQSAVDGANNVWTVGETMYFWDETKPNVTDYKQGTIIGFSVLKNGDVKMEVDFGNRKQKFSLTTQLPVIHKTAPASKAVDEQDGTKQPEYVPDVKDMQESEVVREASKTFDLQEDPAEEQAMERTNADGDVDYFQMAVPEYPIEDVAAIRDEPESGPFLELVKSLRPLVEKNPAFRKVTDYLVRNNAFRNTAEAKEGDVVHFKYDPSLGMYDGKPQMVMYVEKNGEQQVLNVMRMNHMRDKNGNIRKTYAGLNAFWEQVMKEFVDENTPFVFSKTSTIWAKRPGIITYNLEDALHRNKNVTEIPGYNPNAPIVWFSREGVPKVIRGDRDAVNKVYSWTTMDAEYFRMNNYAGRMYYLADNGAGGYIPVRVSQRHFDLSNYQDSDPATLAIRDVLNTIKDITNRYFIKMMENEGDEAASQQATNEANVELHNAISELKGNTRLLLANKMFSFGVGKDGPTLSFIRNYKEGKNGQQEERYDREYFGVPEMQNFEERIANENWAYDFKVDRDEQRAGADMPITRQNLKEYIESGLLQTNAQSFIPKNVDAYIERWDPRINDFKKPKTEEQKSNTPEESGAVESPAPSSFLRPVQMEMGEFGGEESLESILDVPAEFGVDFGETLDAATSFWDTLDSDGLKQMEKWGITKEKFEAMSPDQQEHWKECLGV